MTAAPLELCQAALPYLKQDLLKEVPVDTYLRSQDSPVLRPFVDGLLVASLVDQRDRSAYVPTRHVEDAGLDEHELHRIALRNLSEKWPGSLRVHSCGSYFALILDGNFEVSLLLSDALWDDASSEYAPHGFAVAVPARDVLASCDSASSEGVAELERVISRMFPDGDHLLWIRFFSARTVDGYCSFHATDVRRTPCR
jgi:hypothetical protein